MTGESRSEDDHTPSKGSPLPPSRKPEAADETARVVGDLLSVKNAVRYGENLKRVLDEEVRFVNEVGSNHINKLQHCADGFATEGGHVASFNVNAAAQGKTLHAHIPPPGEKASPDMVVTDRATGETLRKASIKNCKTVATSARGQAGLDQKSQPEYLDMDLIVPKGMGGPTKEYAKRAADKEAYKIAEGAENRQAPYERWKRVEEHTTEYVEVQGVESTARTYGENRELGEKARAGQVMGVDFVGDYGRRAQQGARQAIPRAAKTGAFLSGAANVVRAGQRLYKGEEAITAVLGEVLVDTATGTAAATIKGAASGAAGGAARVAAERLLARHGAEHLATRIGQKVLGGSAPALAAVFTCEAAYGVIQVACGRKTWTELGTGLSTTVKTTALSLIGGMLLGGPFGALAGSFAVPMAVDFARKLFQTAGGDSAIKTTADLIEVASDAKAIGAALTAMAAGQTGVATTRLLQMAALFVMLGNEGAKVFPGRRVTGRNDFRTSTDIVVAHEGRVFAVDLTIKNGTYAPIGSRSQPIYEKLHWKGVNAKGGPAERNIANPLLGPARFADAARNTLMKGNPNWRRTAIEAVMVFPTSDTKLLSDLAANDRYLDLERFRKRLAAGDGRATPRWMLNDLSRLPVWDMIELEDGSISQAELMGDGIVLVLKDGAIDVPFASIAKIEIAKQGLEDADYAIAKVTLRTTDSEWCRCSAGDHHQPPRPSEGLRHPQIAEYPGGAIPDGRLIPAFRLPLSIFPIVLERPLAAWRSGWRRGSLVADRSLGVSQARQRASRRGRGGGLGRTGRTGELPESRYRHHPARPRRADRTAWGRLPAGAEVEPRGASRHPGRDRGVGGVRDGRGGHVHHRRRLLGRRWRRRLVRV